MPTPIDVSEEQLERDLRSELSRYITYNDRNMRKHARTSALKLLSEKFSKGRGDITEGYKLIKMSGEINRAAKAIALGDLGESEAKALAVCRIMPSKDRSPTLSLEHTGLIKDAIDETLRNYDFEQDIEYSITDSDTDAFQMSLVYNKGQMIAFAQATLAIDHAYDIASHDYSLDAEYKWDECISGFYDRLEDVVGTYRGLWKEIALECAFENDLSMHDVLVSLGTDGDYKKQQDLMEGFEAVGHENYLEISRRVREGSITEPVQEGNLDKCEKWLWKMDYCKENGLAPAQTQSWEAADDAWKEKEGSLSLDM